MGVYQSAYSGVLLKGYGLPTITSGNTVWSKFMPSLSHTHRHIRHKKHQHTHSSSTGPNCRVIPTSFSYRPVHTVLSYKIKICFIFCSRTHILPQTPEGKQILGDACIVVAKWTACKSTISNQIRFDLIHHNQNWVSITHIHTRPLLSHVKP